MRKRYMHKGDMVVALQSNSRGSCLATHFVESIIKLTMRVGCNSDKWGGA